MTILQKVRTLFRRERPVPPEPAPTLEVRASRRLADALAAAIAADTISDGEVRGASLAVTQLQNGESLTFGDSELHRVLSTSWNRQIELRESARVHEEERRKAFEAAYAQGIRFSLQTPAGWRFVLSDHFTKCIQKVDKKLQGRVLEAITRIADAPLTVVGDTVKPLTADLKGLWRYRVGNYRLVYDPNQDEEVVTLVSFEPRGDVY
jgi:mRNA-degrading endonuclease RelE of RelBE toxin-antitoxin system